MVPRPFPTRLYKFGHPKCFTNLLTYFYEDFSENSKFSQNSTPEEMTDQVLFEKFLYASSSFSNSSLQVWTSKLFHQHINVSAWRFFWKHRVFATLNAGEDDREIIVYSLVLFQLISASFCNQIVSWFSNFSNVLLNIEEQLKVTCKPCAYSL